MPPANKNVKPVGIRNQMPKFLDIFAGAGGLSEGFSRVGYTPLAHIEMDKAACYTLKTRIAYKYLSALNRTNIYNEYLEGLTSRNEFYALVPQKLLETVFNYEIAEDNLHNIFNSIDRLLGSEKLDLIIGGPPCQAYSLVGRARDENRMIGDKRNYLYILYAEFLKRYQPRYFVFENVLGLLSAKDKDGELYFDKMRNLFAKCGYSIEYQIVNAKDFGVLQNRKRIILIGKLGQHEGFYPKLKSSKHANTVQEIFSDLPPIYSGSGAFRPTPTLPYQGKYLYEAKIKQRDLEPVTFHCSRPHNEQDLQIYLEAVRLWNSSK